MQKLRSGAREPQVCSGPEGQTTVENAEKHADSEYADSEHADSEHSDPFFLVRPGTTDDAASWGALLVNLLSCGGNRIQAASLLGCSPNRLYNVMKKHGLSTSADMEEIRQAAITAGVMAVREALPERDAPEAVFSCDFPPGISQVRMHEDLKRLARGRGGRLEQRFLYLDVEGSADWIRYIKQEAYKRVQRGIPLDALANLLQPQLGPRLDVFALGSGTAEHEVRLVQLLDQGRAVRLYLIDLSSALLVEGYHHAEETLADRGNVANYAINGDFRDLSSIAYQHLFYQSARAPRQRLIVMFGGTFGNLENEPRFVQSLQSFGAGDFLVLHICLATGADPRAERASADWEATFERFITGPLRRHSGSPVSKVETVRDSSDCPVPGSYTLKTKVHLGDGRVFDVGALRRYDPDRLAATMETLRWKCLGVLRYEATGDVRYDQALMVLRKEAP